MSIEQQFIDLIREGKVTDAMDTIKKSLTEMAGEAIVQEKYKVAEKYNMKKKEVKEEEDEEEKEKDDEKDDDKDDKEEKEDDEKDEEDDEE